MNIFDEYDGIAGKADVEGLQRGLMEFFELARDIRAKLGGKAYLLDRYIAHLLAASNETLCSAAADQGFTSGSALRHICRDALNGGDGRHPMFAKAREYLAANQLPYQEPETKMCILMTAMMGEYMQTDTRTYFRDQEQHMLGVLDIMRIKQLYQEITGLLGSEALMERLNLAIRQRFFAVPLMAAYTQGLTNDLVYCLNHRDIETSKQVFQLILDHGLPLIAVGGGADT